MGGYWRQTNICQGMRWVNPCFCRSLPTTEVGTPGYVRLPCCVPLLPAHAVIHRIMEGLLAGITAHPNASQLGACL